MKELFRPEALRHVTSPLEGEVIVSTSGYVRILTIVSVAVVVITFVVLAGAQYPRQETVTGWITPRGGIVRVNSLRPGTIHQLYVREGQRVVAGQPLADINLVGSTRSGETSLALEMGVRSQAAAIESRSTAAVGRLTAQRLAIEATIEDLRQAIAQSASRGALGRRRAELSQREVDRARKVAARGFMSDQALDERVARALDAQDQQMEIDAETLRLRRELNSARSQLESLTSELVALGAERETARAELMQRRTETASQSMLVVVAPVTGEIAALPARAGQSVTSETVLLALTPQGAPLEAELFVPSSAVGFMRPGQTIRLLYDAFPHQKFGAAEAKVLSISPSVMSPGEIAVPGGVPTGQAVYRVRAELFRSSVTAYGREVPLRAGMTLRANVVLDRRTLLEWLLDPLYAAGRR